MSDSELLSLLKTEPDQGFAQLVRTYSGYVYTIANNKLSAVCGREDIEDAVSDIFVEVYRWLKSHEPKENSNLRALLAVFAKRHCIDLFHTYTNNPETVSTEETSAELSDKGAMDFTQRLVMLELIRALGEPDCEIILRRYYWQQSSNEIGRVLKLKPNTVDQKIRRALKKLRHLIEEGSI